MSMLRWHTLILMLIGLPETPAQTRGTRRIDLSPANAVLQAEFTLVSAVRELHDQSLLIVDRAERKLFVAALPDNVVQIGRNGSGPGEYQQPFTLFSLGSDSTLLADPPNGRWLLLRGSAIAATLGPDAPVLRQGGRRPLGADTLGHIIATVAIAPERENSAGMPRIDSALLVRLARPTGNRDTVATLRQRPATIRIQGRASNPSSVNILANPLAAGELAALFPDGWIAIARIDPYRVDWIAPDRRQIHGSPLPFERVKVDERERRTFLEREAVRTGRPPRDPNSLPEWPEIMPPFLIESLLPAPDGRLWIRRTPTADDQHPPYDVIDRRGVLVALVSAGENVQVIGFGRGSVYTVATDDDGIQRLRRHRVPGF